MSDDLVLLAYAEEKGLAPEGSVVREFVRENEAALRFLRILLGDPIERAWGEALWTARDLAPSPIRSDPR